VCLAIPGRLIRASGNTPLTRTGQVDFGGVSRKVNLALVPDATPGDYVLVHAGVAITVLSHEQSRQTLAEFDRLHGET
jgi:hydrogenase expression/formation protein HypC